MPMHINIVNNAQNVHVQYLEGPPLGKGSYGFVAGIVDRATKKRFACKVVNVRSLRAADGGIVARLRNEVAALAHLAGHPGIVQLVDVRPTPLPKSPSRSLPVRTGPRCHGYAGVHVLVYKFPRRPGPEILMHVDVFQVLPSAFGPSSLSCMPPVAVTYVYNTRVPCIWIDDRYRSFQESFLT